MSAALHIVVTIALIYLAIGALLWALVLHPLDQARAIPLAILTWPKPLLRAAMLFIRFARGGEA